MNQITGHWKRSKECTLLSLAGIYEALKILTPHSLEIGFNGQGEWHTSNRLLKQSLKTAFLAARSLARDNVIKAA